MATAWICAYLALGLRFSLDFNNIPVSYVRTLWRHGLLQMAVVILLSYSDHLYVIIRGFVGIREMLEVVLIRTIAAPVRPAGALISG